MLVRVTIKPNSKHHESVETAEPDELVVRVKAPAIEGKANQRAVKLLADYYDVSPSSVRLVRGATSKKKVFEVEKLIIVSERIYLANVLQL